MPKIAGTVRMTRLESAPHSGQSQGSELLASGRSCSNGPQVEQSNSYKGMASPLQIRCQWNIDGALDGLDRTVAAGLHIEVEDIGG